ncbi:DNA polymerase III epsilon subunit-like 3'-5' exonuclease [Rhizobium leguminosarum bv. trifolii WSM2297]|uniref:DNA polymerase III epsilon subunit-like 3'-5' exonuclease n=1 Tax=Rhizobium leguminosarum bv. trifolii WSM2297 TaxID=754762 RepID=J0L5F2_RHILT|nr:3'-5' exonuclease [Rhizobium leguminosarum]EJC85569.1 DNA polymerase III epsilon subunit-like 3'-5' exonuclease [Rhizobium leguminosarum bv. trifolii WSM2297]
MSVNRDSQLDMFTRPSPAIAKARAPMARSPSQPSARSEEEMARTLEQSGNYRILRKLTARPIASIRRPEFSRLGIILDTETTGLNHRNDEIIEIGAVAFTFDDDGAIGDVVGIYGGLQQPSRPIPPEITRLTGITDAMVEGQVIDIQSLRDLIEPADLIIAHNAGFDRPFCEAFSKMFAGKAWACSNSEINWSGRGFEGTKLGYLVGQAGYFHDGHRAVDDCHALLEILDRDQRDGESPFTELYRASQRSRIRIFAEHSPFEMKDHLKARGYRWSDGSDGRLKSWWIEVGEDDLDDELSYLRSDIYRWKEAEPPIVRLTAFDRFKS